MQFIDLAKQQSFIREKIEFRIKNVLDCGKYIMGSEIVELEEKFLNPDENEHGNLQHGNSGATDGVTQFIWDMNSMYDSPRFKHPTYAHVYPQVGKVCVFPIWLHHQVSPFFGEGERRTMSCNIDIINSHV